MSEHDTAGGSRPAPPPNAPLRGPDVLPAPDRTARQTAGEGTGPRIPADAPIPQAFPGGAAPAASRHQGWDALRSSPEARPEHAGSAPESGPEPGTRASFSADAGQTPPDGDAGPAPSGPEDGQAAPPPKKTKRPPTPRTGPFNGKALGPLLTAQPLQRGPDGSLAPVPPTFFSRFYSALGYAPLLTLVLLLAAQVLFTLDARALWYSDEVRHANAFQSMVRDGHWLVLHMNGEAYPDKPPLYFWFLFLIQQGMGLLMGKAAAEPQLFFIGTAVSGLLLLLSTHALARLTARVDGRTSLAAGLILLSGFFFSALLHYSRMDLLFAACITLSHVFLFHAWMRQRAVGLMALGFALAGTATLVKGPLGLAFPLLAGLGFVLWQGKPARLFRLDVLLGLLIGLALPAAWLGAAWMTAGESFITNIIGQQIMARALDTWHHPQAWYFYLLALPAVFLPWSLLLLFLPWQRLFSADAREALRASRTPELAGLAYLWSALLTGLVLLSAVSIKLPIYLLPLFPPLAILLGRALLSLSPGRSRALQYCLALLLFALAAALILLPLLPRKLIALPVVPAGTFILGGVALVAACALAFLPGAGRPERSLLLLALFSAIFSYPAWSITAPSLDVFMSPKAQAEKIKELKAEGYQVFSHGVYAGTYAYYAGNVMRFKDWSVVLRAVAPLPKAAVVMRASTWDKLKEKPDGFAPVHRQIIAEREYVLIARPAPGAAVKAAQPARDQTPQSAPPAATDAPKAAPKAVDAPPADAAAPPADAAAPAPPKIPPAAPAPAPSDAPAAPETGPAPQAAPEPPAAAPLPQTPPTVPEEPADARPAPAPGG